jgi:hypothetical protein
LLDISQAKIIDSDFPLNSDSTCDKRSLFLETSIIALTSCLANSNTVDLPIPDDAPVMTTIFPFNLFNVIPRWFKVIVSFSDIV